MTLQTRVSTKAPMVSGQAQAQGRKLRKVRYGNSGYAYYYPVDCPNPADYIYCTTSNKEGMGGATLKLTLEDGTIEDVQAPWHSNSGALYKATGVDIRDKSLVTYIIAKTRIPQDSYQDYVFEDVLEHKQDILCKFELPKQRLEALLEEHKCDLYLLSKTSGGSSSGLYKYKGE